MRNSLMSNTSLRQVVLILYAGVACWWVNFRCAEGFGFTNEFQKNKGNGNVILSKNPMAASPLHMTGHADYPRNMGNISVNDRNRDNERQNEHTGTNSGIDFAKLFANNSPSYNGMENVKSYNGLENVKSYNGMENAKSYNGMENAKSYNGMENVKSYNGMENVKSYNGLENAKSYNGMENVKSYNGMENVKSYNGMENVKSYSGLDSSAGEIENGERLGGNNFSNNSFSVYDNKNKYPGPRRYLFNNSNRNAYPNYSENRNENNLAPNAYNLFMNNESKFNNFHNTPLNENIPPKIVISDSPINNYDDNTIVLNKEEYDRISSLPLQDKNIVLNALLHNRHTSSNVISDRLHNNSVMDNNNDAHNNKTSNDAKYFLNNKTLLENNKTLLDSENNKTLLENNNIVLENNKTDNENIENNKTLLDNENNSLFENGKKVENNDTKTIDKNTLEEESKFDYTYGENYSSVQFAIICDIMAICTFFISISILLHLAHDSDISSAKV